MMGSVITRSHTLAVPAIRLAVSGSTGVTPFNSARRGDAGEGGDREGDLHLGGDRPEPALRPVGGVDHRGPGEEHVQGEVAA
ncbi:hypothetical protein V6S02_16945, partial [Microbacterium sp. CCNWLW134]|uniref:hypothetical protein n=1 Tax=Microbacterium sp. CCNWLW134 TaxID=3122064 RepID=UPI0030100816